VRPPSSPLTPHEASRRQLLTPHQSRAYSVVTSRSALASTTSRLTSYWPLALLSGPSGSGGIVILLPLSAGATSYAYSNHLRILLPLLLPLVLVLVLVVRRQIVVVVVVRRQAPTSSSFLTRYLLLATKV
jgi:hypothetical protein